MALTTNLSRYVQRQSKTWGGGAPERLERENAGLIWSELEHESGSLWLHVRPAVSGDERA